MVTAQSKNFGLAAGAGASGLTIGLLEGLYRSVDPFYAAFFYGALCSLGGVGLHIGVILLRQHHRSIPRFSIGFALPTALLVLIMGQFIIFRDLFAEDQARKLVSWVAAFGVSVLVTALCLVIGRAIRSNFNTEQLLSTPARLGVAAILAVFGLQATPPPPADAALQQDPKALKGTGVIMIVADALRADALGSYGYKPTVTPTLDALAASGTLFEDATGHSSWTRPAMASIMSSRHVPGHGVMSKLSAMPESLPTLAQQLRLKGVKTGAVVTNYNLEERYGFSVGFDDYRYLSPARYLGAPEGANRLVAYNVYRLLREKLFRGSREPQYFYRTTSDVNRETMAILDEIGNDTFFLWVHYMEPHDPFFAKDGTSFARVSQPYPPLEAAPAFREAYDADIERLDQGVKELLDGLKARGLEDRVTLAFTSDHGEEFGEHGGYYHGVTLYQEMLHIPLFISGPGIPATRRTDVARHIDLAPTISIMLGADVPTSWEGRDLLGTSAPPSHVFAEEDHQGNKLQSIRVLSGPGHKLIRANAGNPRGLSPVEIFALESDPLETTPIGPAPYEADLNLLLEEGRESQRKGGQSAAPVALDADSEAELRALGYME